LKIMSRENNFPPFNTVHETKYAIDVINCVIYKQAVSDRKFLGKGRKCLANF